MSYLMVHSINAVVNVFKTDVLLKQC